MSYDGPTASEIARLRLLVGENSDESAWTAEVLSEAIVERNGDIYAAASDIWRYKAAEMAANPQKWSADGGTYDFTDAYNRCLAEADRCMAMSQSAGGMIIDPTLRPIEEGEL